VNRFPRPVRLDSRGVAGGPNRSIPTIRLTLVFRCGSSSTGSHAHISFALLSAYSTWAYSADSLFNCRILKGNLAPGGAVAKITGKEGLEFTGKARTFDTEDAFVEAVEKGEIKKGEKTVAVLRYLGPKGGPGESTSHDLSLSTSRLGVGIGN
jgi:dihydroxyacid dehydratase/phosphogluconate dehydratase